MTTLSKATHEPFKTEMFAPVMKGTQGKYLAVLSDTSMDRDEERVSKGCLEKVSRNFGYVAGLIDHENKVLNQVCQWTNKRIVDIDGHAALVAEPKFFDSNPNAKIIKGMLDEGAELGISIGAIVKEYEDQKDCGKVIRTFTDVELLEASFVAIPSNRHGRAMAVAKSFNAKNLKERKKMSEEKIFTQKDFDSKVVEVNKDFETKISDLTKQLESKSTKIVELNKNLEDANKNAEEAEAKVEEAETKVEEAEKALEAEKKASLEKQTFTEQGSDIDMSEEDIEKAFKDGKLPIGKLY